jgi:hypothetical protein
MAAFVTNQNNEFPMVLIPPKARGPSSEQRVPSEDEFAGTGLSFLLPELTRPLLSPFLFSFFFCSPYDTLRAIDSHHYDFSKQILMSKDFSDRSTGVLEEADSNFRPKESMMTVAQQIAHTAQTLDWFVEGVSRPEGFDLDFEKHSKALQAVSSLAAARKMLDAACAGAVEYSGRAVSRSWRHRCRPVQLWAGSPPTISCGLWLSTLRIIAAP